MEVIEIDITEEELNEIDYPPVEQVLPFVKELEEWRFRSEQSDLIF